jgi:hypothetical protein
MTRRMLVFPAGRAAVLALGLAMVLPAHSWADNTDSPDNRLKDKSSASSKTDKKTAALSTKKKKKRIPPITNLKVDPKAQHVALFDGMSGGSLSVKVVAQSALNGSLFIENHTQKPLTVEMPEAFVAVQVLRQFGGGGGGGGRGGQGGAGGQQSMGGGMGGMGGGMGGMGGGMGGGGGMFSIPAERTARVPYHSVCLDYGKNDPDSSSHYKIVPVEEYTKDEQLSALLSLVGTKAIDPQVAQAAAWNLSSKLSWEDLANKRSNEPGETDYPYFAPQAVGLAQQLVSEARGLARERAAERAKSGNEKKQTKPTESTPDSHVIQGR